MCRAIELLEYWKRASDQSPRVRAPQEEEFEEVDQEDQVKKFNEVTNTMGHHFAGTTVQKMPAASRSLLDWAEEEIKKHGLTKTDG